MRRQRPRELEPARAWTSESLGDEFVFNLTDEHIAELTRAVRELDRSGVDLLDAGREHFPLPTLGAVLCDFARELVDGRGLVLLRGLPVDRMGPKNASAAFWGIGSHLGRTWPQNVEGHILGDVTNHGGDPSSPDARSGQIGNVAYPFHTDGSDLVGLLCLNTGAEGGRSLVANAVTIHNDLLREAPELLARLYEDYPFDEIGQSAPGSPGWYTNPVFSAYDDRLFVRYIRPYIRSSQRHADAPRLREEAVAALDRLDEMCADPRYHVAMDFRPGDIQLINNLRLLHARTRYSDDPPSGRVRHLKRLWLESEILTDEDKRPPFRRGGLGVFRWWAEKRHSTNASDGA